MRSLFRVRKQGLRRRNHCDDFSGVALEVLERRALLTTQSIRSNIPAVDVVPGQTFEVPITYQTLNASGGSEALSSDKIDFNLHFDQDQITFESVSQLFTEDIIVRPTTTTPEDDPAITGDDNDSTTETVLRARYVDSANDGWPDNLPNNGIAIYVARFTAKPNFSGSRLNFSANETGTNFVFAGSSVELQAQEGPVVSLTNEPVVTEGVAARFTLSLSEAQTAAVTVTYSTEDGNGPEGALAGEDYVAVSDQTVTFQPGETAKSVSISTVDDSLVETDEFFSLKIQRVEGADLGNKLADATIKDNDTGLPRFSIQNAAAVDEGQDSQFIVNLSVAVSETVTVRYSTAGGNGPNGAINGTDFESAVNQLLTFAPNETSKTITVKTLTDALAEPQEEFQVILSDAFGASISRSEAFGRIDDRNSDTPSLTILDSDAVIEGGTATFTVQLSQVSDERVTVDFSTVNGNGPLGAVAGEDFTGQTDVELVFPAGTTQQTISVATLDDSLEEITESFQVVLSNSNNAEISRSTAMGSIADNDGDSNSGDVDGSGSFDANDGFLMHLVKLSGTNASVDQFKGASSLSAAQIRANVDALTPVANVDGISGFDANDTFLIQLVKLSGTNSAIDQFKGASTLTAAEIRANVEALGNNNSGASGAAFAGGSGFFGNGSSNEDSSGNGKLAFLRSEVPAESESNVADPSVPEVSQQAGSQLESSAFVSEAAVRESAIHDEPDQRQLTLPLEDEGLTPDDYWSSAREWMDVLFL